MPIPDIQSPHNAKARLARALRTRKGRRKHAAFLVEGLRHVAAAVEAEAEIRFILWSPERLRSEFGRQMLDRAAQEGIPVLTAAAEVLDSISAREHSQGILAVVRPHPAPLEQLTPAEHPWVVAVIAPQTPGNIGTLLRTLDAVGANALILLDGGASPYHPAAVRASMGALFWLPVVQTSWEDFRAWQQRHGYYLYGSSARGDTAYDAADYRLPMALLLGNERHGLSAAQRAACHQIVRLPMEGHGTSLNLAVAAGILLYTIRAKSPHTLTTKGASLL